MNFVVLFQFIEDELLLINPESSANREYKKLKRVRKGSVVLRLGYFTFISVSVLVTHYTG